jgi:hypothetical protein
MDPTHIPDMLATARAFQNRRRAEITATDTAPEHPIGHSDEIREHVMAEVLRASSVIGPAEFVGMVPSVDIPVVDASNAAVNIPVSRN